VRAAGESHCRKGANFGILRRRIGDYNREGCSAILWRNSSGDVAAGR
jgi:hypothetical protein